MLSDLVFRVRALLRRGRVERELDLELSLHLEHEVDKYVRAGVPRAEAERRARLALGGLEQTKEQCRQARGTRWLEELAADVRYGARQLRASPGFTLVAILSLTLGIGANAAIFQLLNAVRLRSLPVVRPHELVDIQIAGGNNGMGLNPNRYGGLTRPLWDEIRRDHPPFSGVFGWSWTQFGIGRGRDMRPARGLSVSGEFFEVLGVTPAAGRLLSLADEGACPATTAVVSHAFWQDRLGGRPIGAGLPLVVNGGSVLVVGVAPPGFHGVAVGDTFDVALPFCRRAQLRRDVFDVGIMGRLRPGWTATRASTQLAAASPGLFETTVITGYGSDTIERYKRFTLRAVDASSGVSWLRSAYDTSLNLLLGITGLVLLMACTNLANLLFARGTARQREVAVRLALGASRGRLVRQLITESALLAAVGGLLGIGLSDMFGRALVQAISTEASTVVLATVVDWRVLAFVSSVALATCLTFGVVPALRATDTQPAEVVKSGGRGTTDGPRRFLAQRTLVIAQIAVSLVLLFGALLFVRSFRNLMVFDAGLRQEGIVIVQTAFPGLEVPEERIEAFRRGMLEAVRAVPGVRAAATTTNVPLLGGAWTHGVTLGAVEDSSRFTWVSAGYFEVMGVPLLEGRDLLPTDTRASRRVAVVNREFVRRFLQGGNPIGRVLRTGAEPNFPATDYEIVGVVADTRYSSLRDAQQPIVYAPDPQYPPLHLGMTFMVHANVPPASAGDAVGRMLASRHPEALMRARVLQTEVREGLVRERLMALLSGFFGLLAAALATIGLYGVISYGVERRRGEIGIRLALGARPGQVIAMIGREAARLCALGLAIGAVLAVVAAEGASRSALLFELQARDPATITAACLLLAVIAAASSLLPARRASRLDPLAAIRHE